MSDGKIIAAAQEERFNRDKNSPWFPINSINYCLQAKDLTVYDIDYVGFYEKPYIKFHRVVLNHLNAYPFSLNHFLDAMPHWLEDRLVFPLILKEQIGYEGEVLFIKHHLSHAASAFLVSPFEEAAILTADAVGDWASTTMGTGKGNRIEISKEILFPDSLGLLYTAVTTYLGFEALRGEGKVMGLAGYGKPDYVDKFREMADVKADGSFRLDQRYFSFNKGARMYSARMIRALGKPRKPGEEIDQRHYDIAASLQHFTEEILVAMANDLYEKTKMDKLCLAGGVFLNCVANSKILERTAFNDIFIQPAAGDSGGALGVAAYIYHSLLDNPREHIMTDAYLGPEFSSKRIRNSLLKSGLRFREMGDKELLRYVAGKILENRTIGWFQGRMEFGPRALGNRSILANPCDPGIKEIINSKIKKREPFRPFAPSVLEEKAKEFFELDQPSPFMLLAPKVKKDKEKSIPGVTHVDGTARVHTVNKNDNPRLRSLIEEFEKITGVPMLVNTSFNLRGEPIVCTPDDAIDCFKRSSMDCLVLDNFIVEREVS